LHLKNIQLKIKSVKVDKYRKQNCVKKVEQMIKGSAKNVTPNRILRVTVFKNAPRRISNFAEGKE